MPCNSGPLCFWVLMQGEDKSAEPPRHRQRIENILLQHRAASAFRHRGNGTPPGNAGPPGNGGPPGYGMAPGYAPGGPSATGPACGWLCAWLICCSKLKTPRSVKRVDANEEAFGWSWKRPKIEEVWRKRPSAQLTDWGFSRGLSMSFRPKSDDVAVDLDEEPGIAAAARSATKECCPIAGLTFVL